MHDCIVYHVIVNWADIGGGVGGNYASKVPGNQFSKNIFKLDFKVLEAFVNLRIYSTAPSGLADYFVSLDCLTSDFELGFAEN